MIMQQQKAKEAVAQIRGSDLLPELSGDVYFKDVPGGVMVYVSVEGLPPYQPATADRQPVGPHGFHIHAMGDCEPMGGNDPFSEAGGHYNPTNQPHGNHVGDFPVLFSNNGKALMSFFTDKFQVGDIVGKAVVIHLNPDDYRTQPAGDSGPRIGCGVIYALPQ